jgi:mutator protein MutT
VGKVTASGIIIESAKVLLLKRLPTRKVWPSIWDVPGGTLEPFETVEQALRRELSEEVGLNVRSFEYLDTVNEIEPASGMDYVNFMFVVTSWEGSPYNAAPFEHEKLGWFSLREVLELPMVASIRELVAQVMSSKTYREATG